MLSKGRACAQAALAALLRVDPAQRLTAAALLAEPWVCGFCAEGEAGRGAAATDDPPTRPLGHPGLNPSALPPAPPAGEAGPGLGFRSAAGAAKWAEESEERLAHALRTLRLLRAGHRGAGLPPQPLGITHASFPYLRVCSVCCARGGCCMASAVLRCCHTFQVFPHLFTLRAA